MSAQLGTFNSVWAFDVDDLTTWSAAALSALEVLQIKDGFIAGAIIRSPDEPQRHLVTCEWQDVGSYRRALSSTESKMIVWPFLAGMIDQPSAYETLLQVTPVEIRTYDTSVSE